jgi:alkanesulfonate monooxygenase SsuD/methylene tetrahydromethanopterin reductase-like flavin-dependent oxidoreductase (luciferase family)
VTGVLVLPQRQTALVARHAADVDLLSGGRLRWLGGSGETAFDRAARLADGFIFFGGGIEHAITVWERLRERVHRVARCVEDFGAEYVVLPPGSVGDVTAEVEAWGEAGGTHVSVSTMGRGLGSVDDHVDYLASVAPALGLS